MASELSRMPARVSESMHRMVRGASDQDFKRFKRLKCPYCSEDHELFYYHMEVKHGLRLQYGKCPCGVEHLYGEMMTEHWNNSNQDHAILVAVLAERYGES